MTQQLKDRVFKTVAEKLGGHYHVRLFSAPHAGATFACLGTLAMDESDYPAFKLGFRAEHIDVTKEETETCASPQ